VKALILHEYGGPEKLKWEDVPEPVAGQGEVLIRVSAASINPIDYKMRSGAAQAMFPVEFPAILGRDVSGVVRSVGPGVSGFEPGDKVFAVAWKTYAELCVVKASELAKVPEGMDVVNAAALPLVLITGEQLIRVGTGIQEGQTVLVTGANGGVGRAAIRTAKKLGAKVIAGVRKSQLGEAKALGADETLALDDDGAMDGLGFLDAVADTVGGKVGEMLLGKVKQGGAYASVVGPPANAPHHPTVRVQAVRAQVDLVRMLELAEDVLHGKLAIPVDRMIAMEDASEGHRAAEKGGIGKVLLLG
jgi:NADPH:quinone reductase-like Zn-dependent oxidoreductase